MRTAAAVVILILIGRVSAQDKIIPIDPADLRFKPRVILPKEQAAQEKAAWFADRKAKYNGKRVEVKGTLVSIDEVRVFIANLPNGSKDQELVKINWDEGEVVKHDHLQKEVVIVGKGRTTIIKPGRSPKEEDESYITIEGAKFKRN